jgi:hypothetical protein
MFLDISRTIMGLSITEVTGIGPFQFGAFEVIEYAIMFESGRMHPNSARCY